MPEPSLVGTHPETDPPSRQVRPSRLVLAAWLACLIMLVAIIVSWLGSGSDDAQNQARRGSELIAAPTSRASVTVRGDAAVVAGPRSEPTLLNLAVHPFDARGTAFAIVDAEPLPPGAQIVFLWVRRAEPKVVHEQVLKDDHGRVIATPVNADVGWEGEIVTLALAVKNPSKRPVVIRQVRLQASGARLALADLLDDWSYFGGFDGKSINVIFGGREDQRVYLPAVVAAAAFIACLGLLFFASRLHLRAGAWLVIPFAASWMLLDLRWQWELSSQAVKTQAMFAGKTLSQRHAAMEHPAFFALVQAARAKLPDAPARVLVTSDFDYFRLRAGYYLYPHNVLAFDWADPSVLRRGDFLLMFAKSDVKFDDATAALQWSDGRKVPARALVQGPGEGLFQIQ
jgi:hypothetical protein